MARTHTYSLSTPSHLLFASFQSVAVVKSTLAAMPSGGTAAQLRKALETNWTVPQGKLLAPGSLQLHVPLLILPKTQGSLPLFQPPRNCPKAADSLLPGRVMRTPGMVAAEGNALGLPAQPPWLVTEYPREILLPYLLHLVFSLGGRVNKIAACRQH